MVELRTLAFHEAWQAGIHWGFPGFSSLLIFFQSANKLLAVVAVLGSWVVRGPRGNLW